MAFFKVSEVLKASILRSGDPSSLVALQVFKAFQGVIFGLYGKKHTKAELLKIKPKKFSWGILTILVSSSVWSQELKLKSPEILDKINQRLGEGAVKKIIVQVKV
jgi:hypothetical protein